MTEATQRGRVQVADEFSGFSPGHLVLSAWQRCGLQERVVDGETFALTNRELDIKQGVGTDKILPWTHPFS